jgi:hypothetical protein
VRIVPADLYQYADGTNQAGLWETLNYNLDFDEVKGLPMIIH